ncbi:MAG: transcriptional regulator [Acidithiobacillus sp.]|nr:helix-turn-helix transcriptional regulator [Oscillospiraceae bacterium MB24-C1]
MDKLHRNLDMYQRLLKMLAVQFGSTSEIVLHDLTGTYERTIVGIENGHITGRKVGDCGSNLGLEVLRADPCRSKHDTFGYLTYLKDGRILRSSSMYINDDDGRIVGCLCINTDITALQSVSFVLSELTTSNVIENHPEEVFAQNVGELVDYHIERYRERSRKEPSEMDKSDKLDAIRYFDEKGVFLISKSSTKICKFLHISKGTLYSYLEIVRSEESK